MEISSYSTALGAVHFPSSGQNVPTTSWSTQAAEGSDALTRARPLPNAWDLKIELLEIKERIAAQKAESQATILSHYQNRLHRLQQPGAIPYGNPAEHAQHLKDLERWIGDISAQLEESAPGGAIEKQVSAQAQKLFDQLSQSPFMTTEAKEEYLDRLSGLGAKRADDLEDRASKPGPDQAPNQDTLAAVHKTNAVLLMAQEA